MVLVAGIAAGVLVNSAGSLQAQAQQTGEETQAEVSNSLSLDTVVGESTSGDSIDKIKMNTRLGAGSGAINLSRTIFVIESDGKTDTVTSDDFSISEEQGSLANGELLTSQSDVAKITIDFDDTDVDDLGAKDTIEIIAEAPSGSRTDIEGQAPTDIQDSHIL
jgi:flagellin FlaB